jgi:hypothetical protein
MEVLVSKVWALLRVVIARKDLMVILVILIYLSVGQILASTEALASKVLVWKPVVTVLKNLQEIAATLP